MECGRLMAFFFLFETTDDTLKSEQWGQEKKIAGEEVREGRIGREGEA